MVLPEPFSHFSVHSTFWLLLLSAGQPACNLWLHRRVGHQVGCTVLRLSGAKSTGQTSKRKRSGWPSCLLFGRFSCEATTNFCSCQHYSRLAVCSWIKEWAFGTVHTTKPSMGNNDLGYPVSPEAAGPRPSMQPTGNNMEIPPKDCLGSSIIFVVISYVE